MVIHTGQLLHCPAALDSDGPNDERITLQGHGFLIGGKWRIFW
jgi:hypothetical protein